MFGLQSKNTSTSPDELTSAKKAIEKLVTALSAAESESSEAKAAYDHALRGFLASGKDEPSPERQRSAAGKCESLRRLLAEARERLARLTAEAENARRLDTIRASGGLVAAMIETAEKKLLHFEQAVTAVRKAEAELFDALFSQQTGLRQRHPIVDAQRDADFARQRLRRRAINIAEQSNCPINARFESDGEAHFGPLERSFYAG
jgi:aminopeptidase N